jgi:hypothetical protein
MEVRCQKCHKIHSIPDSAADNKRVFFYCNNCGQKIVIDKRQVLPETDTYATSSRSFKDILNAVRLIFNSTTFILTLIYTLSAIIICSGLAGLFIKQPVFFTQYSQLTLMVSIVVAVLLLYGYSMLLYMISKINFYKIEVAGDDTIDWKSIMFDFKEDAIAVFFFSIGVTIFFVVLLIPILFLGSYSLLYAGITLPLTLSLAAIMVICCIMQNFIPAIIASKSLFVLDSIREVFAFVKREILHIPFYLVAIEIITSTIHALISGVVAVALAITGSGFFFFMDTSIKKQIANLSLSLHSIIIEKNAQVLEVITPQISIGIILCTIFSFILLLIIMALYINIKQAFYTQACSIMQNSPGKSINRSSMITALFILFFSTCTLLAVIAYILL